MKLKTFFLFLLLIFIISGCAIHSQPLPEDKLIGHVNKNIPTLPEIKILCSEYCGSYQTTYLIRDNIMYCKCLK